MRVAVFNTKSYDRQFLDAANAGRHELRYFEPRLSVQTAPLARDVEVVCAFVNDQLDRATLTSLADQGIGLIALRSAGFNNVDLVAARELGLKVGRVPGYSPQAVAEHTVALILALNRKLHRAYMRVREGNFSLEGLLGFNLHGKTAGVVGTGQIGETVAGILAGFGCHLLAHDPVENPACVVKGVRYVTLAELFASADIISLHCPLTPATRHLVDRDLLGKAKPGLMLINTSRGAVIDTRAVIAGLKTGRIGSLGLDVYEEEGDLFFEDLSATVIQDDVFARLLTFPNVLITGHQAFFTTEALAAIAQTTIANIDRFAATGQPAHEVSVQQLAGHC